MYAEKSLYDQSYNIFILFRLYKPVFVWDFFFFTLAVCSSIIVCGIVTAVLLFLFIVGTLVLFRGRPLCIIVVCTMTDKSRVQEIKKSKYMVNTETFDFDL